MSTFFRSSRYCYGGGGDEKMAAAMAAKLIATHDAVDVVAAVENHIILSQMSS